MYAVPPSILVCAWENHIQPLLCDICLIMENLPPIDASSTGTLSPRQQQQQLKEWLRLVSNVSAYCLQAKMTAWPAFLAFLVHLTAGTQHPSALHVGADSPVRCA